METPQIRKIISKKTITKRTRKLSVYDKTENADEAALPHEYF